MYLFPGTDEVHCKLTQQFSSLVSAIRKRMSLLREALLKTIRAHTKAKPAGLDINRVLKDVWIWLTERLLLLLQHT